MVKILFFASLRELVGRSALEIKMEGPTTVGEIYSTLVSRYPDLERFERHLLAAVNREYASLDHPVSPGDEVAFFPPVSGGSRG